MDTQDRCLRNVNTGQLIPSSVMWIPEVLILEEEPLENSEILPIIDTSEYYSCYAQCFSAEQVARRPKYKFWNYQISLQHGNAKIPTRAIYTTT